ncbi:MAG: TonB-dependent receptor [Flavobacteriales bacterium]
MRLFISSFLLMLLSLGAISQNKVTLSGYVKDKESGEGMIAATVLIKELNAGTVTNEYGFYSLSVAPGSYTIEYSFIGFETVSESINLTSNITKNVEIGFSETLLEEVVITEEKEDEALTSVEMSVEKLDIAQVKKIPQLLGEADIIRSIQLLPGVTTVGEGATGFNVRGGNIDQNLILLDESPVFSSSHLFGFFSVFNADAIKDAKLYKGGVPAKYGGRLSSVLDIRQKEGNLKQLGVSGGVGLLFSRLTIEAPIWKDRASFIVSGRRSYFDIFFPLANDQTINDSKLFFYDLNGKINLIVNENNRLYLAGYFGDDVFDLNGLFKTQWGNRTGSLRWNHLFSEKLFSNFTAIYSNYNYKLGFDQTGLGFDWRAEIENISGKADFTFYANPKNTVEFGWHNTYYYFTPGAAAAYFEQNGVTDSINFQVRPIPAFESAIYLSNEQKIGTRLTLAYGLRYSGFAQLGAGHVYKYPNNEPIDPESPTSDILPNDTIQYKEGEIVKLYHGLEPRFSVNFQLDEYSSIKGSYNRMRQYIHLISNTTAATPVDIYMPAGPYIKPGLVDQVAVGYFRNFYSNSYEASAEVYYKYFQDLVDYKDGAELLLNNTLETELYTGDGQAYGLELQIKRKRGKFTGWVSYTLSRVERVVAEINNGDPYPANWNKTHDVSLVLTYDITKRWNVSSNFAYMSGRPITYPDGRFSYGGVTAPIYSGRNGGVTPAYHRLDLAVNYTKEIKRKYLFMPISLPWGLLWKKYETPESLNAKSGELGVSAGVYNLYGRHNPYSIYFQQDQDMPEITKAYRLSIYAIPIPYVTLNFKF